MGIGDLSRVARAGENLSEGVPALRQAAEAVADTFHAKALAEVVGLGQDPSALAQAAHVMPEVSFRSLAAQDQMLSALQTANRVRTEGAMSPLQRTLTRRAPEFNVQPDGILPHLFQANWTFEPVKGKGGTVNDKVFSYRATVPGVTARLNVAPLDNIPPETKFYLNATTESYGVSAEAPSSTTDHVRAIVAKDAEHGNYSVVDLRPGRPIQPSLVDAQTLSKAIDEAGMAVPFGPPGGLPGRIELTHEQLLNINKQLPPEVRLTVATTEVPGEYRPAAIIVPSEQLPDLIKPLDGAAQLSVGELRQIRLFTMRVPDPKDSERYERLLAAIPRELRPHFVAGLNVATKNPSAVERTSQIRGLLFEMSRLDRTLKQGLETVASPKLDSVLTRGPRNPQGSIWRLPQKDSTVQLDIPILREDGKPYILEVKSYSRRHYGEKDQDYRQISKYQDAIDRKLVSGATLETTGVHDPDFLSWIRREQDTPHSIPDLEVLHTIPLPSGAEFTLPIKPVSDGKGLRFFNNESAYTAEDWRVVEGARRANSDRSIDQLMTSNNIENAPPDLQPYVDDPDSIPNMDILHRYEQLRLQALWDKLAAKSV